jgi:hypothetical protein
MHWWYPAISARNFAFALLIPVVLASIIEGSWAYVFTWGYVFPVFGLIAFLLLMYVSKRYDDHFTRDVFNAFYSYCVEERSTRWLT